MQKPIRFCFKHERIKVREDLHLQLEVGILHKLSSAGIYCLHESCDKCPEKPQPQDTQPSLFGVS